MSDLDDAHAVVVGALNCGGPTFPLEGAFDPKAYLAELRKRASNGVNHPVHGSFWRLAQSRYAAVETVLSDPEQRRALASMLRAQKDDEQKQLVAKLGRALDVAGGDGSRELSPEQYALLVKVYVTSGGLEESVLKKLLSARGMTIAGPTAPGERIDFLPESSMSLMEAQLRLFEAGDLYRFLGVANTAQLNAIKNAIAEQKTLWQSKRVTAEKASAQSLISFCDQNFATAASRDRYDLSLTKRVLAEQGVLDAFALATLDGRLDSAELEQLMKHGAQAGLEAKHVRRVLLALAATASVKVINAPKPKTGPAVAKTAATSKTPPVRKTTTLGPTAAPKSGSSQPNKSAQPAVPKPAAPPKPVQPPKLVTPAKPAVPPKPKPVVAPTPKPATPVQSAAQTAKALARIRNTCLLSVVVFVGAELLRQSQGFNFGLPYHLFYGVLWAICGGILGRLNGRGLAAAAVSGISAAVMTYLVVGSSLPFQIPFFVAWGIVVWASAHGLGLRGGSPFFAGVVAGVLALGTNALVGEWLYAVIPEGWGTLAAGALVISAPFIVLALWARKRARALVG